jgi:uracil-DNA glycosylase
MPILHPSYLLRNPSERPGSPKALTLDDLRLVQSRLAQLPAPL